MANEWRQLLFDWEKGDRNRAALLNHLRLCALPPADQAVIMAIHAAGELVRDGEVSRTLLQATIRELAELAHLSPAGVHLAKTRLVARGLLAYHAAGSGPGAFGVWVLSWAKVWGLPPAPDPVVIASWRARVHDCSRPYQEKTSLSTPDPDVQTKSKAQPHRETGAAAIADLLAGDPLAKIHAAHQARVRQIALQILGTVARAEDRTDTPEGERLRPAVAREIAEGICGDPDGAVGSEYRAVLESIRRAPTFDRSPAAYIIGCAQKRRWYERRRTDP